MSHSIVLPETVVRIPPDTLIWPIQSTDNGLDRRMTLNGVLGLYWHRPGFSSKYMWTALRSYLMRFENQDWSEFYQAILLPEPDGKDVGFFVKIGDIVRVPYLEVPWV